LAVSRGGSDSLHIAVFLMFSNFRSRTALYEYDSLCQPHLAVQAIAAVGLFVSKSL